MIQSDKLDGGLTWRVSPETSDVHRGSFINSQAKIVGSFLYSIPVTEFLRVSKACELGNRIPSLPFSLPHYHSLNDLMFSIKSARDKDIEKKTHYREIILEVFADRWIKEEGIIGGAKTNTFLPCPFDIL